jgi:hypothetical protein
MDTVTGQREYVVVPRIPTKEMLADGWYGAHEENAASVWELMIEAWERSLVEEIGQSEAVQVSLGEDVETG